jgi:hypothetical protein
MFMVTLHQYLRITITEAEWFMQVSVNPMIPFLLQFLAQSPVHDASLDACGMPHFHAFAVSGCVQKGYNWQKMAPSPSHFNKT